MIKKLIFGAVYFGLLALLIRPWSLYVIFVIGGLLGLLLLWLDELKLYRFYNDEPRKNSPNRPHSMFLATRSVLFMAALIPLSLFVVTSTGSPLGSGLVLGLLCGLIVEIWQYRLQPDLFKQRFWSQVKNKLGKQHILLIWLGLAVYLLLLSLLALSTL